jgi:hypothetical protein
MSIIFRKKHILRPALFQRDGNRGAHFDTAGAPEFMHGRDLFHRNA